LASCCLSHTHFHCRSDLHEYDFNRNSWSAVNAAGRRPRARYRATCVVCRNQIVLFGGHDGTRHMADTHVFDIETRIWSALVTEGTPPTPRDSHVSLVQGSSMYVFGGSSGSAINDLHELQLPSSPTSAAKWYVRVCGDFPHQLCTLSYLSHPRCIIPGALSRHQDRSSLDTASVMSVLSIRMPCMSLVSTLQVP